MGMGVEEAALGILRVANEHMVRALRVISVQRGVDPREHVLVSFGGAGGLHVCALADALGMDRAMVPVHAGVLSALGMLATPPGRLLTRTWLGPLAERTDGEIQERLDALAGDGTAALLGEGQRREDLRAGYSLDLRYRGQSYTLNLPWEGVAATAEAFHRRHAERYGHRLDLPVELVNLRVRVRAPAPALDLSPTAPSADAGSVRPGAAAGSDLTIAVLPRTALAGAGQLMGPAVILDPVATTWLAPGWAARLDAFGNIRLEGPGAAGV
jgi:N-methylhydantoinase A